MDVLTDVLRRMQVRGEVGGELELGVPWSVHMPEMDRAMFHIVSRGGCFLKYDDETVRLGPGDLAFFPHGAAHTLSDDPERAPDDYETLVDHSPTDACGSNTGCRLIKGGGDGPKTTIICAMFHFASGERHPLLTVLPPLILLRSEDVVATGWLADSMRFIAHEARSSEPGAQIAVDRLLDLLFVQTVRAWVRTQPASHTGWLGALSDPQIADALGRLHEAPRRDWTVDELAREVGMSRSGFAARFAGLVGEPPLRYLSAWRMKLAAQQLIEGDITVGKVGRTLGYSSEAAFGVVFKKHFGAAPAAWRRAQRSGLGT